MVNIFDTALSVAKLKQKAVTLKHILVLFALHPPPPSVKYVALWFGGVLKTVKIGPTASIYQLCSSLK